MGSLVIPDLGVVGGQGAGVAGDSTLRILDPDDEVTVLFDMNDGSGANNPSQVCTYLLGDLDIGTPPVEREIFESSAPGGSVAFKRRALTEMSWRIRMTASSIDKLRAGAGEMFRLLDAGGVLTLQLPGMTSAVYIDYVEGGTHSGLLDGREIALFEIVRMLDTPKGITVGVLRQPYLRGPELLPATQALVNGTLLEDVDLNGTPTGWTLAAGTGSIVAADEAFQNSHTAAASLLTQNVTASNGQTWTLSGEARRVSGNGTGRLRLSSAGGVATGDSADISSSSWQPYSVTVTMDASTTAAQAILRQHTASGTTVLQFRRTQLEQTATASPFRSKSQTMSLDPSV